MNGRHSSDELRAWAWQYSGNPGRKLVLLAICQWVNPRGELGSMTVKELGELIGCMGSTRLRFHMRALIAEGLISRTQVQSPIDGRFAVASYQVNAPWLAAEAIGELNCRVCRAPLAPGEVGVHRGCARQAAIEADIAARFTSHVSQLDHKPVTARSGAETES